MYNKYSAVDWQRLRMRNDDENDDASNFTIHNKYLCSTFEKEENVNFFSTRYFNFLIILKIWIN